MAAIGFVQADEKRPRSMTERMAERPAMAEFIAERARRLGLTEAERDHEADHWFRFDYFTGGPDAPVMYELNMSPGNVTEAHAHDVDQVVYVVEGELRFGRRVVSAGGSAMIPKFTLYAYTAGPEGVTYLTFLTRAGDRRLSPEELKEHLANARAAKNREAG